MTDNHELLPQLTTRQEEILSYIVRAYTDKPEPISSNFLVNDYDLSISSATVRNEMARLEEMGYIAAPHTSAGRIPTALGYRYVVRRVMRESSLTKAEEQYIETKFNELPTILEHWMRQAATMLARTSQTASIVTPPIAETSRYKHLELISIQGRLALVVLVLQGGSVHQRMFNLAEPVPQSQLSEAAQHINAVYKGMNANQIRMKSHTLNDLERDVAEIVANLIDLTTSNQTHIIYRDGLSEIINAFPDGEGAQQAVRVYEERAFIDIIFTEILHPILSDDDVQVVIAGNGHEEINRLSLVLSHYGIPGKLRGALGVMGPTNLNYGRAISTVRYISSMMTDMLGDLYDDNDQTGNIGDDNMRSD